MMMPEAIVEIVGNTVEEGVTKKITMARMMSTVSSKQDICL